MRRYFSVVFGLTALIGAAGAYVWVAQTNHDHPPELHPPPDPPAPERALPPGHGEVHVPEDRMQMLGVRLGRAQQRVFSPRIRASGVVQADETREAQLHARVSGWIEELFIDAVGQVVEAGDALYSLYSPELIETQLEYLAVRRTSPNLAAAARRRLELWDVPQDQIQRLDAVGLQESIVFRAPLGGTVLDKNIFVRSFVEPGVQLYRLADLSVVWILADIYELEVSAIDPDGMAHFTVQGVPGHFAAIVDYIYPVAEPDVRTVRVRLVARNDHGTLRPNTFATVDLPGRAVNGLWVSEHAVIDTGVRELVYLHLGRGHFRPIEVRSGMRAERHIQILEGLQEGDEIAESGQFLIDSESRLEAVDHVGH